MASRFLTRGVIVAVSVLALSATPKRAHAQPKASDTALATELFNTGRDLMKEGSYAAACPKLAESARLDPKVGTLARLAECDEKIGHLALARGHWQQALNLARASADGRASHAQEELDRIDKIVPKVNVVLSSIVSNGGSAVVIKIDETTIGEGSLGVALPVDPGRHTIVVSQPGKKAWSTVIELRADGSVNIVDVPPLVDDPSASIKPTTTPTPTPTSSGKDAEPKASSSLRTIGIVAAGVGLVSVVVGSVFAISAKSKLDDSNAPPNGCVGNNCPPDAAAIRDDARSAGNLATVFFIAGGALAVGGVALWLIAPKSDAKAAPSAITTASSLRIGAALGNGTSLTLQRVW